MATLFLMVGLPGAGKTARAKELAAGHGALRLSPDAWMVPLFGDPEAAGKRDVLEGRLIWLAMEALCLGTSAVLDFGFWARDERSALRWLAASAGASCQVVYLPVDRDTQLARLAHREAHAPRETFAISQAEADRQRSQFEAPDASELAGTDLPGPPPGWEGWPDWAADRWPSLAPRPERLSGLAKERANQRPPTSLSGVGVPLMCPGDDSGDRSQWRLQLGQVRDRPLPAGGVAGPVAGFWGDTLIQAMPVSTLTSAAGIQFAPDGEVIVGPGFRTLEAAWIEGNISLSPE